MTSVFERAPGHARGMPLDLALAYEAAKKLSEIVDFVSKVKGDLSSKPEAAARDLAVALDQIYATFQAVATEIGSFLALGASVEGLQERAPSLSQLQGVVLSSRIEHARGHCKVIANIYHARLDKWFQGSLSQTDYLTAKSGFTLLGEADDVLFRQMADIADAISTEAEALEELTLEAKWEEARQRVLASRKSLRAMERMLGDTMDKLSELKAEFIALSGAPSLSGG